jgi:hypothetical protein
MIKEIKKFNVKFKDKRQLDRTVLAETETQAREYINKKYPNREIVSIQQYNKVEELI